MYKIIELDKLLQLHVEWLSNTKLGKQLILQSADLQSADLQYADLQSADLQYANLQYANLQYANLRYANLQYANLQHANLQHANLQYANLQYADLDFSVWPLHRGSFNAIVDDRLVSQLIAHITRLDISNCSDSVQKQIKTIRDMSISDLFCKYCSDIKPIKDYQ